MLLSVRFLGLIFFPCLAGLSVRTFRLVRLSVCLSVWRGRFNWSGQSQPGSVLDYILLAVAGWLAGWLLMRSKGPTSMGVTRLL